MLRREEICALMPHEGKMCLIEKLLEWDDDQLICSTESHMRQDNPLRSNQRLNAIHAAEYGAQAMALHGGLLARQSGASPMAGFLVSLRGVKLHRQRLDDTTHSMIIRATKLLADSGNLLYDFQLTINDIPVAEGNAAVMAQREG
jgi:predicted hotdog family 3-hydroxylacyl-ACP dehydratase